jgi:putative glycosyltransferase (TIGR04348 family)
MRIGIVTPAPPHSYAGNSVTALRWQDLLRELGHKVEVTQAYTGQPWNVLVALHARKSAPAIERCASDRPNVPIVLALTGTDLYPDLTTSGVSPHILELAARFVVLQPLGVQQLPTHFRPRARVIFQSVPPLPVAKPRTDVFEVALLTHLRPVKDPFRLAEAVHLLPPGSAIRVLHLGAPLQPEMAERARQEMEANPRYCWLGEVPRTEALRILARCRLLALTSWHEGGANVISEAIAASVPVVSSRIPGSIGLLGPDYPGYFTPGDTRELADLLNRLERNEGGLLDDLRRRCAELRPLFEPARERESWRALLAALVQGG